MSHESLVINRKTIDSTMIHLEIIIIIIIIVIITILGHIQNQPNTTFLRFYFAKFKHTFIARKGSNLKGDEP